MPDVDQPQPVQHLTAWIIRTLTRYWPTAGRAEDIAAELDADLDDVCDTLRELAIDGRVDETEAVGWWALAGQDLTAAESLHAQGQATRDLGARIAQAHPPEAGGDDPACDWSALGGCPRCLGHAIDGVALAIDGVKLVHDRLDDIGIRLLSIEALLPPAPVDRVPRHDAEQVIHQVITDTRWEYPMTTTGDAEALSRAIAERLYGTATEMAPVSPGDRLPGAPTDTFDALRRGTHVDPNLPDATVAVIDPTTGDSRIVSGVIETRDEGAPTEGDGRRPLDLRGHACTRPVGPVGPPYGEPPACGKPTTEVDSIGRPRCPEHLAQVQTATSIDDEADGG